MTGYSPAQIEDAVLAALKAQLGALAPTIAGYQGDWQEDLKQESRPLPAVLLMPRRGRGEQVTLGSYDLELEFTVLAAVRPYRGEAAARREAGGLYDLLAGVRAALWGRDLGLEILPFALTGEEELLTTPELAVHAAHYRTALVLDL